MSNTIDVVVIGGGYAGVMAANRLTQRDHINVTVINPRSAFVPRLRLHQLLGGTHDAVVDTAMSWPRASGSSSTARRGSTRPRAP